MTSRPPKTRPNARSMWRKTTDPEGGSKARRRKRLPVAPRRGGTAASTVLSIGHVANQRVSAQRRTAEPAGIGPKARPDGPPNQKRFGAEGEVAPTVTPPGEVALQSIFGVADHGGTDRGWRTTRKGRPDPKRFGAAVKAIPDGPAMR